MSMTTLPSELIARYDRALPRYTSYPTVPYWGELSGAEAGAALERAGADDRPLSLYLHIPFCDRMCLYCGCNVVVTRSRERIGRYVEALERELSMVRERLGPKALVQLHFGGGTPTMLEPEELGRVLAAITGAFAPAPEAEMSIELDPVVTRTEHLEVARAHGLNRLSVGVQDFDAGLQALVERHQTVADAERVFADARRLGFASINVDLMYGLPQQTVEHVRRSARRAAELGADRLAVFGYAHVPWLKPHQKKLEAHGIPGQMERWAMATAAREVLTECGYVPIGMDHYARPADELALAAADKRLFRNFQGYTVLEPSHLVGLGMTGISEAGGAYLQNHKRVSDYYAAIDQGRLACHRGLVLAPEDELRRTIIHQIMCNLEVDLAALAPGKDFATELEALEPLAADGLVVIESNRIRVSELGRVFVRNIASVFDTYLGGARENGREDGPRFSRAV